LIARQVVVSLLAMVFRRSVDVSWSTLSIWGFRTRPQGASIAAAVPAPPPRDRR